MTLRTKLATATAILVGLSGAALAQGNHGHGGQGPGAGNHDMMPMMMQMHAQMMGGNGPMAGMGMMGGGAPLMAMGRFDADGDGTVSSDEAHEGLQALLAEYDADGDETLSLTEFETLHSALIRETMVDRFQFLDDDGDGMVTMGEIVKPADMMGRMQAMRERMMQGGMMAGPYGGMQGNGAMMGTPGKGRMGNN